MQRGGLLLLAEPLTEPAHESGGMLEMCRGGMRCRVTECTASVRSTCERVDAHSGTLLECLTHVSVQPKTPLSVCQRFTVRFPICAHRTHCS